MITELKESEVTVNEHLTAHANEELNPAPPFAMHYSSQLPELIHELGISLALTTYQAGKLVTITAPEKDKLVTLPRTFDKPMGIDVQGDKMVVACKDEVIYLENSEELARNYPNKPDTYDALYVPKMTYHTGQVDMHDIKFGKEGVWAVNSSFSCLCQVDGGYNFIPRWQPKFISDLAAEDRCHLNGLVMVDGYPRFVTALGTTDTFQGWRDNIIEGGVLIDLRTDENILENLPMPHSPIMYKGALYMLLSATGELIKVDTANRSYEVIKSLDGFCRGLDIYGDYAFIGMSKLRSNSSTFSHLDFAEKADLAGIKVIHLPSKSLVGEMVYTKSVDEIYEVKVLQNMKRPNILNNTNPVFKYSLAIPGKTFWARPDANSNDKNKN